MSRRLKLIVEYDGTEFSGWQLQQNGRSVQAMMEFAAREILQEQVRIHGAGRTDAGVHARGQVAHFDTISTLDTTVICRGLNALLPDDVTVHDVAEAAPDFHARFSASSRTYVYTMVRRRISINRRTAWMMHYPVKTDLIRTAIDALRGTYDFISYSKHSPDVTHCVCHVFEADWIESGEQCRFRITANRFLYGMVRLLLGALIDVGRGKMTVSHFVNSLERGGRRITATAAPAHGLLLESVQYDADQFAFVKRIMDQRRQMNERDIYE